MGFEVQGVEVGGTGFGFEVVSAGFCAFWSGLRARVQVFKGPGGS